MKKLMKGLVVATIAMVFAMVSVESNAQKRNVTVEEYAQSTTEKMDELVDLNKKQEKKIYSYGNQYAKVLLEMREKTDLPIEERRAKVKEAREILDAGLKKTLTAEQLKIYNEAAAKRGGCCKKKATTSKSGGCCGSKATTSKSGGCCKDKATTSKSGGCCGSKSNSSKS